MSGLGAAFRNLRPFLAWGLLPFLVSLSGLLASVGGHPYFGGDFHVAFWPAGDRILHGITPYVSPGSPEVAKATAFVYPAPAAVLFAPFALIDRGVADAVFVAILLTTPVLTLRLLEIADWRVYGASYLWAAIASGWVTGNVTLLLVVAVAAIWRWRERAVVAGCLFGLVVAFKLWLWPLGLWLLATRRYAAVAWAAAAAAVLSIAGWAVLGFGEIERYQRLVRALVDALQNRGYTLMSLTRDLGAGRGLGYGIAVAIALAVAACCVLAGRRGQDVRALTLAITVALLATPLVWLHYFALFLVPVALVSPQLGPLWLIPLAYWLCIAGAEQPRTWQQLVALATTALMLRMLLAHGRGRTIPSADGARPAGA